MTVQNAVKVTDLPGFSFLLPLRRRRFSSVKPRLYPLGILGVVRFEYTKLGEIIGQTVL